MKPLEQESSDEFPVDSWLEIASAAATSAGHAIMEVYESGDFEMESKSDHSPLTRADLSAHRVIAEMLAETGLPVLSEEGRSIPYEERRIWEWYWLVDPLDGTKEFIKRNGEFTVNIALMRHAVPVAGVIYIPVSGHLYSGQVGRFAIRLDETGRHILTRRAPVDLSASGIRVVASRTHRDPQTEAFIAQLQNPEILSRGSSLKFLLLAEGKADVYPRFAPTMEWDTAAAHAILSALDIKLISAEDNLPLRYNKENLLNPFFLCKA